MNLNVLNSFMHDTFYTNKIRELKPYLVFVVVSLCWIFPASAQEVIRVKECKSEIIKNQVDSLKKLYAQDGFIVIKEASITMESEYEMPVIVPLQQNVWYQFVFIGEPTSRLYEVRMYDWSEKQVIFQQKRWGDVDGNIISYSYQPRSTEFHMMKPVQVNKQKKRDLCGYVMLLKKTQPAVQQ
jgi:hypothetical protein